MKKTFSKKELTEYLKQVVELETTVYRLQQEKKAARDAVRYKEPRSARVEKPVMAELPSKPNKPVQRGSLGCGAAMLAFGVVCMAFFLLWAAPVMGFQIALIIGIVSAAFFIIGGGISIKAVLSEKQAFPAKMSKYEEDMAEWERAAQVAKSEFEQETRTYEQRLQEEERRHEAAVELARSNYDAALAAVKEFDAPIEETKALLERLYSVDVIFPKYRNLIAMCTMYEYFATGRVDALAGPHGAYNLYEQELRQNIIIGQLDSIIKELDQIKQNQYTLYQAVQKVNTSLSRMNKNLDRIAQNTDSIAYDTKAIAEAAGITASCAQAIASNTEALKYIELVTA